MLSAVILVLREALEAALIISVLLAISRLTGLRSRWCAPALLLGFCGSLLMATFFPEIAEAFEGAGQELLGALLLSVMVLCLLATGFYLVRQRVISVDTPLRQPLSALRHGWPIYTLLVVAVVCAIAREGFEVWIYLAGFLHAADTAYPALIGGAIGLGIGASLGVLCYYALIFVGSARFLLISMMLLALIAGGLSVQVVQDLMQAGYLDSTPPVWDSSAWIAEDSLSGQLLYALIGYEARPTVVQVAVYCLVLLPFALLWCWQRHVCREK